MQTNCYIIYNLWCHSSTHNNTMIVCVLCMCVCVCVYMRKIINKVWEWPCPLSSWVPTTYFVTILKIYPMLIRSYCTFDTYKMIIIMYITIEKLTSYTSSVLKFRSSGENPVWWSPTMGFGPINLPTHGQLQKGRDHSPLRSPGVPWP